MTSNVGDSIKKIQNAISLSSTLQHPSESGKDNGSPTIREIEGVKVSERLGKLKTSSEQWKSRVEEKDAKQFTVAAKLKTQAKLPFAKSDVKQSPPMHVFKSANPHQLGLAKSSSMMVPVLPSLNSPDEKLGGGFNLRLKRSLSVNDENEEISNGSNARAPVVSKPELDKQNNVANNNNSGRLIEAAGAKVTIPRSDDDETFTKFFTTLQNSVIDEGVEIADFDIIKSTERLAQKRIVQGPKGRRAAKNPIRALAARNDLQNEYVEVKTGVAEKELRRLKLEQIAKSSNLAVEALAGLASVEDFKSVSLKSSSLPLNQSWLPYKPLMLLHVKGRTHIQTRLVEPIYTSINRGDCFILIAYNKLYRYVGSLSNVIEKSRSKNICAYILENKDLGCTATNEILISDGKMIGRRADEEEFWRLLKKPADAEIAEAGHSDEDDLFESCLIETNKIYEFVDDQLIPMEKYWGTIPKVEMLDTKKVIIFNFGSEVYVWNGKNATSDCRRAAIKLVHEQFIGDFNYGMCQLNPLNFSIYAGDRQNADMGDGTVLDNSTKVGAKIPDWCLLAKVTQHMETILFREKFLDWPSYVGDAKKDHGRYLFDGVEIKELDGVALYKGVEWEEPNLMLENANLGRGNFYYDNDTMRHFDILTTDVLKWQINEYTYDISPPTGHFFSSESYIIRWIYQISVTVRELTGQVSKRSTVGRSRCVYFCWQGIDSSANEKGAAALLTVELDKEKGAQLRLSQGDESTAFVRLFKVMVVHKGKQHDVNANQSSWRMYAIRGNDVSETILTEVNCDSAQLRSQGCLILVHGTKGRIILWKGLKSLQHTRDVAQNAVEQLKSEQSAHIFSENLNDIAVVEMIEGDETDEFFTAVGEKNRTLYQSMLSSGKSFNYTPRLFNFSSTNGQFEATELLSGFRTKEMSTPFPFTQLDLYKARQPTIFLIDNGDKLWLWQGWWPKEDESPNENDNEHVIENRSGENRWQAERRAAMQTAVAYWRAKMGLKPLKSVGIHATLEKKISTSSEYSSGDSEEDVSSETGIDEVDEKDKNDNILVDGFCIWAGLEPLEFISIFPEWVERNDIKEINLQDGRSGTPNPLSECLALLSQSEYPLSVLLERPLPEGVDPTKLENYLSDAEFETALGVSQTDFEQMPQWKQTNLKRDRGLF